MPFVTIHFVVGAETGVEGLSDLEGRRFIAGGKGTFCEKRVGAIFDALGLSGKVEVVDVELSAASAAMRNDRVAGFATCSSHPTPQLVELATTTPLDVLSLTEAERDAIIAIDPLSGPLTIAAGAYKGQDADVATVGVPVGGFGTTAMSDEVAYEITRSFWAWKDRLARESAWWDGVTVDLLGQLGAPLHPGARRYYEEAGVDIPESLL